MTTNTVSWWRITRNVLSLALRELLNKGTYLLLGIGIARVMGKGAFGEYTLSLLLSRCFFTFGELGLGTWLVREVSKAREHQGRYFATLGLLRILTGFGVLLLLGAFLALSRYGGPLSFHILLSACAFFFIHLISFIFSFFRAFERMESELQVGLVKNVLFIAGGLFGIFQRSLDLLFYAFIASSLLSLLYALWLYRERIGWQGLRWKPMPLSGVVPIWMIQSVVMVYLYLATVLVSFFRGVAEVGLYQAAYSFVEVIFVVSTVLTVALFPVFSRLAKESPAELYALYEATFRACLFFFAPFGILALFGARTFLLSVYGASFHDALPALYLLLSGFLFFLLGGINSHLLIAVGREQAVLAIVLLCTAFNLVFSLGMIPRFGFVGAGASTFLSEFLMFSLMLRAIVRHFRTSSFLQGKTWLSIVVLWVLCLLVLFRLSFWAKLPLGLGLYGLLAAWFHRPLSKELHAAKSLWRELRGLPKPVAEPW